MAIRCSKCGVESPLEGAFHRLQITRRISRWYCPPCQHKRDAANNFLFLFLAAVAVPIGLAVLQVGGREHQYGWHLLTFALFMAVQIVCIVPHELGHALSAICLGMRVFALTIGSSGKLALAIRVLGYDVAFMAIPLGGSTLLLPKSTRFVRLRYFITVLCGPLANVLLIGLAVWLGQHFKEHEVAVWAFTVFVVANLFILAVNLYPHTITLNGKPLPTDGRQLLSTPFLSRELIESWHASYFALEGAEARERGSPEAARRWFAQGLAAYPDDANNLNGLALMLLDDGDYFGAKQIFERLLEQKKDDLALSALFQNNIAWTDLLIGDRDLLDKSDRFSSEAFRVLPWVSVVRGTRGSVLIELGRIEEGVSLVKQAMNQNRQKQNQAFNACYLALAMLRDGNSEKAGEYQEAAVRLDPKCKLLNRLEDEKEKLEGGAGRA